ncbi:MAG: hypothetical protein IJ868_10070 [Prevotella sp.]|nr:hypothetical protein [Prevotella sp.]
MRTIIAVMLSLLVAGGAQAQTIRNGSEWYGGGVQYTATILDANTVRMSSESGTLEMEFLLKHDAGKWDTLFVSPNPDGDEDAFIVGMPEGTRCRLMRGNGSNLLVAYDGLGAVLDVYVETPDQLSHNERTNWMAEYAGPYTVDCKGDCPNIGIGYGTIESGSLEIPWDIVLQNNRATQIITIADGDLKGQWAVFPTLEGLELNKVRLDDYGMPIEQDEKHTLRWADSSTPRFNFAGDMFLSRYQLSKYDLPELKAMRNTIVGRKGIINQMNVELIKQVEAEKRGDIRPGMLPGEWEWKTPEGMDAVQYLEAGNPELTFSFSLRDGKLTLDFCGLYRIKEFDADFMVDGQKLIIYDAAHRGQTPGDIHVELTLQKDGTLSGTYNLKGYEDKPMKGQITMRRNN